MDISTLRIDPDTRDLIFDESGCFEEVNGSDAIVQNVRHALLTWKNEFFADTTHGTDYERIFGLSQNDVDEDDVKEVIREAIFQEPNVVQIESMVVSYDKRSVSVTFSAELKDGDEITLEVNA